MEEEKQALPVHPEMEIAPTPPHQPTPQQQEGNAPGPSLRPIPQPMTLPPQQQGGVTQTPPQMPTNLLLCWPKEQRQRQSRLIDLGLLWPPVRRDRRPQVAWWRRWQLLARGPWPRKLRDRQLEVAWRQWWQPRACRWRRVLAMACQWSLRQLRLGLQLRKLPQ